MILYTKSITKTYYYIYILACSDGTYYTGKTVSIEKRLKQHNGELSGGAKYTRTRRPVQIMYQEVFSTHHAAAKREHAIKQLTREEKTALIKK